VKTTTAYSTIGAVRQRLAVLGLPTTVAEIQSLRKIRSPDHIRDALGNADTHPRARAFLTAALAQIRLQSARFASHLIADRSRDPDAPTDPSPTPVALRTTPRQGNLPTIPQAPNSRETMLWHGTPGTIVPTVARRATRDEFHVYGSTAALTVSGGRNRTGEAVVFLDAAAAIAPRNYDWANKICLMLTPDELPQSLAVATGDLHLVRFAHHGPQKDKWAELHHQGTSLYIKIAQGKRVYAVPISPSDTFKFAALLTAQIRCNVPAAAQADVASLITMTVAKMQSASTPARPATSQIRQRKSIDGHA